MEGCSVGNHDLNKKGWNGLQIRLRRCHNRAAETLRGCLKVWVFTNQIQKWEGPGKCKRKHLAKREQGISEGLLCGSHCTPLQLPSHTLWNCSLCWFYLDWASPQGPRVWNQDKIPHCFQKQEKLKKEQHKQTQNHLLFQHLQAYFPFYDPFGKQSFLKRTNIILQSSPPRHGHAPRSKSPASDLRNSMKLTEGDAYCHALNTPLGNAVRQQPSRNCVLQLKPGWSHLL